MYIPVTSVTLIQYWYLSVDLFVCNKTICANPKAIKIEFGFAFMCTLCLTTGVKNMFVSVWDECETKYKKIKITKKKKSLFCLAFSQVCSLTKCPALLTAPHYLFTLWALVPSLWVTF